MTILGVKRTKGNKVSIARRLTEDRLPWHCLAIPYYDRLPATVLSAYNFDGYRSSGGGVKSTDARAYNGEVLASFTLDERLEQANGMPAIIWPGSFLQSVVRLKLQTTLLTSFVIILRILSHRACVPLTNSTRSSLVKTRFLAFMYTFSTSSIITDTSACLSHNGSRKFAPEKRADNETLRRPMT